MARKSTIKLLLVNESDNTGERLVSLFRNAGRVVRASRAASAEEFFTAIKGSDEWDLLIVDDHHSEVNPEQCLEQLKKCKLDIPTLVIRENCTDMSELLSAGASDVIDPNDQSRLCFAAFKEVDNYDIQRNNKILSKQLAESEQRCEVLLKKSQDSIAYISDGMVIGANQLFAESFGYADSEELDCLPIIDMIALEDRDKFKALLKSQVSGEDSSNFSFTGRKENGENFSSHMQLSNASYDSEHCVQLTMGQNNAGDNNNTAINLDHNPITGLYSRDFFISQLNAQIKQATAGSTVSSILFISIDQYSMLRKSRGLSTVGALVSEFANHIQIYTEQESCLAHYCDDLFTLLMPDTNIEKALAHAQNICQEIYSHIFNIANQTLQCTVSIGVVGLDGKASDPYKIIDGAYNACEQIREEANNNGIGNNIKTHIPERERKSLSGAENDEDLDQIIAEAIEDQRFNLSFQPIVSLKNSNGDHYEVQVNIINKQEQLVSANVFLNALNLNNVNTRLDRWIILEASKSLSVERDKGHDIKLLINLSPHTLQDKELIPWLSVALKAGGLPADVIAFQFSEMDLTENLSAAISFSDRLKKSGCGISINGFGDGDESIKILKHVNADFVQLHNSFTQQLEKYTDTAPLKALIASIKDNNSKTIIPDIQSPSALAVLWQIGADFIQGDYLAAARPVMDHEFTDIA